MVIISIAIDVVQLWTEATMSNSADHNLHEDIKTPLQDANSISIVGEESPALESVTTVSMKDGHTWWNSQISMSPKGKEYSIQFGTYSKDAYDRVSKLIATIMDEEYAATHY